MKIIAILLFTVTYVNVNGQMTPTELAKPIVDEGRQLFRSEMASWYGTDIMVENYKNQANIGGYFSYSENQYSKCIFFSKADQPKVIGTIIFDSTYNINTAQANFTERDFSNSEYDLYTIRKSALQAINSDTIFKRYNGTNLNLIPIISNSEKKVYVLSGPKESGVVVFGNDYLITFDANNIITSKKQLHKNIIPIYYGKKEDEGKEVHGTTHTHLPETGEFITATDICTLMLYAKYAKWKEHIVVSEKYMNIWNCESDHLVVVPMSTIDKINKQNKKKKDE